MEEFQQALVLSPNNGQASFYLRRSKQALDNTIEDYFLKARRDYDSLKYRSAIISYCAIIRLLQGYAEDERFKQAQRQINGIEKILGMFEGEYKCFEEQ